MVGFPSSAAPDESHGDVSVVFKLRPWSWGAEGKVAAARGKGEGELGSARRRGGRFYGGEKEGERVAAGWRPQPRRHVPALLSLSVQGRKNATGESWAGFARLEELGLAQLAI